MKNLHICFFRHTHQPYYTDPTAGSTSMLCVRLHLLEKFPAIRSILHFTPSLFVLVQEVGSDRVWDLFPEYAQRLAADMTIEEKGVLIRHSFSINCSTWSA